MTKFVCCLIIATLIFSCQKETEAPEVIEACGVEIPTEQLPWLKDLIAKAESDMTGQYKGSIYLEEYKGDDIFWVAMAMGSGGVAGYWFDCEGNSIEVTYDSITPENSILIYSSIP